MRILTTIIIVLVSTSCSEKATSKFSLDGTTKGLSNGTILYLIDSAKEKRMDSVQVQNNSFNLTTSLPSSPIHVVLKNNDNSLYKRLWLENKPMLFDAAEHDFENAVISGSDSKTSYDNLNKAVDTLPRKEREELLKNFIKTNADNILGAYVLWEVYIGWKKERTEPLYQQLSEKNKNSFYGKKILKYIELNQNPKVGERYVDFEMIDQHDKQIKLSDLKSKLVLLEFWASWCAPCRKDNKDLIGHYNKYKPLGFEIFQVSLDDNKEEWLDAIKQDNLVWNNASDLKLWNNQAAMIYGINLLPSNFLIDENGIIISRDLRGKELEQKIREILE